MTAVQALRRHWPEYAIEAWALGTFMLVAATVGVLFEHPRGWLHAPVADPDLRRVLAGIAMGLTAVTLIHTPWGRRSGAHMNPAVTLTYWRLGKILGTDALYYVLAQFAGGTAGVYLAWALFGAALAEPPVSFVATVPGAAGSAVAFACEIAISAGLMATVLSFANCPRLAPWTGVAAGVLVAFFIAVEAPYSGMSMNPARSFASAVPSADFSALWIYLGAPLLGMTLGAALHGAWRGPAAVRCAKLLHTPDQRCIHCGHTPLRAPRAAAASPTGAPSHDT
jgi:aquaporin Z